MDGSRHGIELHRLIRTVRAWTADREIDLILLVGLKAFPCALIIERYRIIEVVRDGTVIITGLYHQARGARAPDRSRVRFAVIRERIQRVYSLVGLALIQDDTADIVRNQ